MDWMPSISSSDNSSNRMTWPSSTAFRLVLTSVMLFHDTVRVTSGQCKSSSFSTIAAHNFLRSPTVNIVASSPGAGGGSPPACLSCSGVG